MTKANPGMTCKLCDFGTSPVQIVWGFPPYVLYGKRVVQIEKSTGRGPGGGKLLLTSKLHERQKNPKSMILGKHENST